MTSVRRQTLYTRYVRAEFLPEQPIVTAAWMGGVSTSRPRQYISLGSFARIAEIAWICFVLAIFLFLVVVMLIAAPTIGGSLSDRPQLRILQYIGLTAFWLFCLQKVLIFQAYVRWMLRHRHDTIPKR